MGQISNSEVQGFRADLGTDVKQAQVNAEEATTHPDLPLLELLLRRFQRWEYSQCVAGLGKLAKQGSTPAAVGLAHIYFHGGRGRQPRLRHGQALARIGCERRPPVGAYKTPDGLTCTPGGY